MKRVCLNCNKPFESKRKDAKFDSAKCRVSYSRVTDNVTDKFLEPISVTKKTSDVTDNVTDNVTKSVTDNSFIPNWKRKGYTSKDHAIAAMLKALEKNSKNIMKHGLDLDGEKQPIDFYVKGRTFTLTERGFKK